MKIYTKIVIILVVLAVVVTGVIVVNKSDSTSGIKIGFVGPFTGKAAQFGEFMHRGLILAKDGMSANEVSGLNIIEENDTCSGPDAIAAVQKLITVDHVKYVVGPLCNAASIATEKLFEDNKVISISIGLPTSVIANMGPYHFSFSPEIELLMKKVAEEMGARHLKKVAIIHGPSAMEEENYRTFIKHSGENGIEVVGEQSFVAGTTDFRDIVLKIKDARPDAIMLMTYGADLNNILKQMEVAGLNRLPKFGIHAAEGPVLASEIGLAEGLIYPYPSDNRGTESAMEYARLYQEKYGTTPDLSSTNVYDSLNILLGAIKKCGYDNSDCVRDTLANLKDYQGANGNLSVDGRGVGTYNEIMLKTVKGGKFVKL